MKTSVRKVLECLEKLEAPVVAYRGSIDNPEYQANLKEYQEVLRMQFPTLAAEIWRLDRILEQILGTLALMQDANDDD